MTGLKRCNRSLTPSLPFYRTQVGVWTGTSAAQKHIKESGREEAIAQGLKLAMDRALAEIRANSSGIEIKNTLLNKVARPNSSYGDSESSEFVDVPPSEHEAQPGEHLEPRLPQAPLTFLPTQHHNPSPNRTPLPPMSLIRDGMS